MFTEEELLELLGVALYELSDVGDVHMHATLTLLGAIAHIVLDSLKAEHSSLGKLKIIKDDLH